MANPTTNSADGVRRRDFIHIASGSFLVGGVVMAAWPAINQMNPSADVLALATTEVDLGPVAEGQAIRVMWFIRNRPTAKTQPARKADAAGMPDPQADKDRVKAGKDNWLVLVGVCTHLGCVPLGTASGEPRGDYGGWFCPCHGSHYDTSGRIRKGPAPKNLEVPQYAFTSDTKVLIG
jgi:ubiquinol-cytochrome c reductase iron-sulfur subunit